MLGKLSRVFLVTLLILLTITKSQAVLSSRLKAFDGTNGSNISLYESNPDLVWSKVYIQSLISDTKTILVKPLHWNSEEWKTAELSVLSVSLAAGFDRSIQSSVQTNRTISQDDFFKKIQNLGSGFSFAIIGSFEICGDFTNDIKLKRISREALEASIIGPGLLGTSLKYTFGRVRPNSAKKTFDFKSFSGSQSFPSGHTAQAFALATTIASEYDQMWIKLMCYSGAVLVGYARIEQNTHYASDVTAGAILGWSVAKSVLKLHHSKTTHSSLTLSPYIRQKAEGLMLQVDY